ncbi:MAG: PqiC family protein [Desulfuromonadales bacterium]|nr:PqiC family protein [Desulfuromonadales bacterium]
MDTDRFGCKALRLFLMLIFVALLAGCVRTPPVSYYQLSSRSDAVDVAGPAASGQGFAVGLGPVQLPEYLERIQLVSRTSANQLQIMGDQRWAEPLATAMPRVLGEDLALLLGNARILRHPWVRSQPVDRQVLVEILQFEGGPERAALLTARWSLLDGAGKPLLAGQRSSFQVDAASGTEGLVAALSEALWRLAGEIAVRLGEPSTEHHP